MEDCEPTSRSPGRDTVTVRVDPESSTHLRVGSRWEVVDSSLDSLWEGAYTVTLKEIAPERA